MYWWRDVIHTGIQRDIVRMGVLIETVHTACWWRATVHMGAIDGEMQFTLWYWQKQFIWCTDGKPQFTWLSQHWYFHCTLWHVMVYYQNMFGWKQISTSEDMVEIVIKPKGAWCRKDLVNRTDRHDDSSITPHSLPPTLLHGGINTQGMLFLYFSSAACYILPIKIHPHPY